MLDLHDYNKRYENAKRCLLESDLNEYNKSIIFRFQEHLVLIGVGRPRILKYLDKLRRIGLWLGKDFDKISRQDVERVFVELHQRTDLKMSTKIDYNIILKRFYKWLLGNNEEFPEQVKWLKTTLKYKDKTVPNQADLISEEEIQKLLAVSDHPRNKALISLLFETGCRIGELANLTIGNVMFDQYGCILNVNGKTGPRRIRVVNSATYLTRWLDMHPLKNNRDAPIWIILNDQKRREQMKYEAIRKLIRESFTKAGINKRCNPHIFRHSRATFMANHMTEAQMKVYFGWVQASDMASTYVHLSGRDTDNAILELNGLSKKESIKTILQPKICPKCGQVNSSTSNYCNRCSGILDIETTIHLQEELESHNNTTLLNTLLADQELKEILSRKITEIKLKSHS